MLLNNRQLYSLKDVAIMPAVISDIEHRSECNPYYDDGKLPIFTAPMPCVVNSETYHTYEKNHINAILPRTEKLELRLNSCHEKWCAFSLDEFITNFIKKNRDSDHMYVLIDIANGNMRKLLTASEDAKKLYGDKIKLMVGNVANPHTFEEFCNIGVDYVRCSVGSGAACNTTTFLGILYPMASLIDECNEIRKDRKYKTKIIADGGLSSYRRMFKALALGADYVMLGSTLNKLEDSAGEIVTMMANNEETKHLEETIFKEYYGMASKKGMEMLSKTGSPEGKIIYNRCKGTIESFSNEFTNYLRSVMSYCNKKDLKDFIGGPEIHVLTTNASNQFNQN